MSGGVTYQGALLLTRQTSRPSAHQRGRAVALANGHRSRPKAVGISRRCPACASRSTGPESTAIICPGDRAGAGEIEHRVGDVVGRDGARERKRPRPRRPSRPRRRGRWRWLGGSTPLTRTAGASDWAIVTVAACRAGLGQRVGKHLRGELSTRWSTMLTTLGSSAGFACAAKRRASSTGARMVHGEVPVPEHEVEILQRVLLEQRGVVDEQRKGTQRPRGGVEHVVARLRRGEVALHHDGRGRRPRGWPQPPCPRPSGSRGSEWRRRSRRQRARRAMARRCACRRR